MNARYRLLASSTLGAVVWWLRQNATLLLLVGSTVVNLTFAWRLREAQTAMAAGPAPSISVGQTLPALAVVDGPGGVRLFDKSPALGRPTVFYFWSPRCSWCERNLASLRALVEQRKTNYRFVAVSLEPAPAAVEARYAFFDERVTLADASLIGAYGVRGTPLTVVTAPTGAITAAFEGAFRGAVHRDIESAFAVSVPATP